MHLKISTLIRVALRPELNIKKQTQTCKKWHFWSDVYSRTGHPCKEDFETFGKLIGLNEVQVQKALHSFTGSDEQVKQLISNSYLDERSKRMYLRTYEERISRYNRKN